MEKQRCDKVINQNAEESEGIGSLDNIEVFGIRPKQNEEEATIYPINKPKRMDEINRHVVMDIHDALQKLIKGCEKQSVDREKTSKLMMYEILCQAIAWWATALTLESFLGKRIIDKRKVASLSKA
jgi:hypothetical protein